MSLKALTMVAGQFIFSILAPSFCLAQASQSEPSVCQIYNDYVTSQCVPQSALKSQLSDEMRADYSVTSCREQSFATILESDEEANALCKLTESKGVGAELVEAR